MSPDPSETLPDPQTELLAELQQLEDQISPQQLPAPGEPWFRCVEGTKPVLVSAPHACRHLRSGVEKMNEEYTAAMAMWLARTTGCHAIYTTHKSVEDPNFERTSSYKAQVAELIEQHTIRFVVDLHGMINRHHMGLALGTMSGQACDRNKALMPFVVHGFEPLAADEVPAPLEFTPGVPLPPGQGAEQHWRRVVLDHPRFTGGLRNHTVTRFAAQQPGVSAVQVEIASVNRIVHRAAAPDWPYEYHGNPQGIVATAEALQSLVNSQWN